MKNGSPGETALELGEQRNEKMQGWRDDCREGGQFRQRSEMTSQACRVQSNEILWYIPPSNDNQTNITASLLL